MDVINMVFLIRVAERIVEIHSIYDYIHLKCRDYIVDSNFCLTPDVIIRIAKEDLDNEIEMIHTAEVKGTWYEPWKKTPEQLEVTAVYRKLTAAMLSFDTILMHGAVISTNGKGYMIAASRGVGKSTRSRIWVDNIPGSYIINGDKPLLRFSSERVYAYGTPWCGKEGWNKPASVPLHAILFLERTDNEEDESLEEIGFGRAISPLIQQVYFNGDPEDVQKTLQLLKSFNNKVKFYHFRSAPTKRSVISAYEKMQQQDIIK